MNPWHAALGALALGVTGFAVGRYTGPTPPARVEYEEIVVYRDRVVTVRQAAEVKRVVVYRERTTSPDGTVIDRVAEHTDSSTHTVERVEADRQERRDTRQVTTNATRPDWRVGILAGGTLTPPLLPVSGPLTLGVHVERRIAGPFSVGVWGLSSGQAGVSLSVEF